MKSKLITAIVLTKNEQESIIGCLKSLNWVNEIIVVDDNSTDKTVKLCRQFGAKVFNRPLNNDFSAQRNFALDQASCDWLLFVDADERVSPALKKEILSSVEQNCFNGFLIKRDDFFWGKKVNWGEVKNIWLLRLAKRNCGRWIRPVHEIWEINGPVGRLTGRLWHYPANSLSQRLKKINYYSGLHAESLRREGKTSFGFKIILWPLLKFINNYLLKFGFLDGSRGLIINLLMSLHSFLSQGKLWLLTRRK